MKPAAPPTPTPPVPAAAVISAGGGDGGALFKLGSFAVRLAVGMASSLKEDAERMMKSIEAEQEAKVRGSLGQGSGR
jgi:hypothetical protein